MGKPDLLKIIDNELKGVMHAKDVELGGHKYNLRLLDRAEESIAKSLMGSVTNPIQALSDTSASVLAVALRSIDGQHVDELFGFVPDDFTAEQRDLVSTNADMRKRMVKVNMLEWLGEKPSVFVEELWRAYLQLKDEAKEALEKLRPLSVTTPS